MKDVTVYVYVCLYMYVGCPRDDYVINNWDIWVISALSVSRGYTELLNYP